MNAFNYIPLGFRQACLTLGLELEYPWLCNCVPFDLHRSHRSLWWHIRGEVNSKHGGRVLGWHAGAVLLMVNDQTCMCTRVQWHMLVKFSENFTSTIIDRNPHNPRLLKSNTSDVNCNGGNAVIAFHAAVALNMTSNITNPHLSSSSGHCSGVSAS